MTPAVPDRILRELGRTEGGAEALALLVRDQHTRRLLLLRALLDAADAAPRDLCPPELHDRLRRDWALLEEAEGADRTAVRGVLFHPLAGSWAQRLLRGLTLGVPAGELRAALGYFSALCAAAAVRARLPFEGRLGAPDGTVVLPTLGVLRIGRKPSAPDGGAPVHISLRGEVLTLRHEHLGTVRVTVDASGTWSDDPRWRGVFHLPPLLPGASPVPLDDIDPYRAAGSGIERHGLGPVTSLEDGERKAWAVAWSGVEPLLRTGGEHRVGETVALLHCLVPLAPPPGGPGEESVAHCSGTSREAFGAVLSSKPATSAYFAATLVHELQHTKLAALGALTPLHHEDGAPRHFAPWRSDPRPFDGLLQGAYSHLALADYWQRFALVTERVSHRDLAWAEHARCQEQVGAVLPVLAGSSVLTPEGRTLVNEMISLYHRLSDCPPPAGHRARAQAYVRTTRTIWRQRNQT